MKLPALRIGDITARIPIVQGGMGVGVSRSGLAAAVGNAGGIGVISGVGTGWREPDFRKNSGEANVRGLRAEIRRARELAPDGILGVNILMAMNAYKEMMEVCVQEKVDLIISGAGIPMDLPQITAGSSTKNVPIVSSAKAANVIAKLWDKRYQVIPDAFVVEGPDAGGHLGFSLDELAADPRPSLLAIVREVIEVLKPYVEKYGRSIPIIAAGGIFSGCDIAEQLENGAAGVQMATRFVATHECDADIAFKQAYLDAKEGDVVLVKSPVGMPGRAIRNPFVRATEAGRVKVPGCVNCLKPCDPSETPYCISDALFKSVEGDVEGGLIFAGVNAPRVNEIVSVQELMDELVSEAEECYSGV